MESQERNPAFVQLEKRKDKTLLILRGEWTIKNSDLIQQEISRVETDTKGKEVEVASKGIEKLDTSGAMFLKSISPDGKMPRDLPQAHRALLEFLPPVAEYKVKQKNPPSRLHSFFINVGRGTYSGLQFLWEIVVFIGKTSACLARNVLRPHHLRFPSFVRHIKETGVQAVAVVGLLAVSISMVITYQGAVQLKKFGADIYTIDLTVISLLREMGVLVTAIMVAGRSGSAFAAEIGVMKLREEVSALKTMGVDPIEVLVLPRVLALIFVLPLLTFIVDVIGLIGGSIMALSLLNISILQYFNRVQDVADTTTFFIGLVKAPVFAFLIAIIGCYQGLNVSGSAESIGKKTTLAVVQSIFLVILTDALFSVAFSKMDI